MSSFPSSPSLPDASPGDDSAFYRAALRALIDVGTELARDVRDARRREPPAVSLAEAAEVFERVARAVRRTVLLATRLDERPAPGPAARRRAVIRAVQDAITADERAAPEDKPRLEAEFRERLDAPEMAEDLAGRPVAEVVAEILRDMDLGRQPWARLRHRRRTPDTIRRLRALAAGRPVPAASEADAPGSVEERLPDEELARFILARDGADRRPEPRRAVDGPGQGPPPVRPP